MKQPPAPTAIELSDPAPLNLLRSMVVPPAPPRMGVALRVTAIVGAAALIAAGCGQGEPNAGARSEAAAPRVVPLTNMILIQPGSFMRSTQQITLTKEFWLGKFEVTQGEYSALMGANPSHFTGDPNRPVEKVSHADAANFCATLTKREYAAGHLPSHYAYRLPTEAEWEYACRAGSTNLFSFGNDENDAAPYAWTEENSGGTTHPVGQKLPNAWRLHDMHGNVWEWCEDWYSETPSSVSTNPVGPAEGKFKMFHGGGWSHPAKFARSANRFMMAPSNGIYFVGFRVALSTIKP